MAILRSSHKADKTKPQARSSKKLITGHKEEVMNELMILHEGLAIGLKSRDNYSTA
jgi:hypothetical protein